MNFSSAFESLGYTLRAPRTDWSADSQAGVCLSLWAKEITYGASGCSFDTLEKANPIETWNSKPGFRRRQEHLAKAIANGGRIDVVIVTGTPGGSYEDAHPWLPEQRKGMAWFLTSFDPATGHFRAETRHA
jgi:hypothetical protein